MNLLKPKYEIGGKKYVVTKQIGEGAYAFVYQVKPTAFGDSRVLALKKLICQTEEQLKEASKEIKLLSEVRHPNVLHLIGSELHYVAKKDHTEALLLMPLYDCSVQDIIDHGPGYPNGAFHSDPSRFLRICLAFAEGLQAIHAFGYRHSDFKPANILVRKVSKGAEEEIVLTDLGSACPLTVTISTRAQALTVQEEAAAVCTASYRAPELLDTPSECFIDGKTDVWSIGCTLFNMLYSRTPFETPGEGFSLLAACAGNYKCPSDTPPFELSDRIGSGLGKSLIAITHACLAPKAENRPHLRQTLSMIRCCYDMPWNSVEANPACMVFSKSAHTVPQANAVVPLPPVNQVITLSDGSAIDPAIRDRCATADSLDEFGDFESAPVSHVTADIHINNSSAASAPMTLSSDSAETSAPLACDMERDSIVSISSANGFSLINITGTVVLEGPVQVMRPKRLSSFSHKIVRKTVWGVLTTHGIAIRKTADPSSKVHAVIEFSKRHIRVEKSIIGGVSKHDASTESNTKTHNPYDGLGDYIVSVIDSAEQIGRNGEGGIVAQRVHSDTDTLPQANSPAADMNGGVKRRKSVFGFGSSAGLSSSSPKEGTHHSPQRRSSLAHVFSNKSQTAHSGPLQEHQSPSPSIDFGLDTSVEMNRWFEAISSTICVNGT